MLRALLAFLVFGLAAPALAADGNASWSFGGDSYKAGRRVTLAAPVAGDAFIAGERVTLSAEVAGSAHAAGRNVVVNARIGQNLYAAGQDVAINAPVGGNATLMGQSLTVTEPVSGNLRLTGQDIELSAPVAGSAVIGGQTAVIDAAVSGDLALAVEGVDWRDGARVAGKLHIYAQDPGKIEVPASVAAPDRIVRHEMAEFSSAEMPGAASPGFFARLKSWLGGVLVVGVLGTLFAAIAPGQMALLRDRALARPWRSLLVGFVALSALIGAVVPLAMTGIGLVLVPISLILAVLLGLAGYVIGTYVIGVWATGIAGRGTPQSLGDRAIAAFAGAAIVAAVALVPWLGWLAVMLVFLTGGGLIAWRVMRRGAGPDGLAA